MSWLEGSTQDSPGALYKVFCHYFIFKVAALGAGSNYNAHLMNR